MGVYGVYSNIYHCVCSQPGYKGKYCHSPTQVSVTIGYGASVWTPGIGGQQRNVDCSGLDVKASPGLVIESQA